MVWHLELAHRIAEHQRYTAALQQSWRVPLGPLGPELLRTLSGIRHRVSLKLTRASCPGYGYARSSGIHAYRHAVGRRDDEEPCGGCETWRASIAMDGRGAL